MDDEIGRVVSALDRKGLLANTIIVFQSDNGGTHNAMFAGELPLGDEHLAEAVGAPRRAAVDDHAGAQVEPARDPAARDGETAVAQAFLGKHAEWHVTGDGFTWDTQNREQHIATAERGCAIAARMLADPSYQLVVLDELTYLLSYGYLDSDRVFDALAQRPPMQHVVVTGRGAPEALIELADTVSIIAHEKHAFRAGIKAQPGIDL